MYKYIAVFILLLLVGTTVLKAQNEDMVMPTELIEETILGLSETVFGFLALGTMGLFIASGVSWILAKFPNPFLSSSIVGFLTFTAIIHTFLGLSGDLLLGANGLGYFVILGLQYLPIMQQKSLSKWLDGVTIIYTAVTIIGYFLFHSGVDTVGIAVKIIEVILITLVGIRLFFIIRIQDNAVKASI